MGSARFMMGTVPRELAWLHVGLDHGVEFGGGLRVSRKDVTTDRPWVGVEDVFAHTTCLANQNRAGGYVPRREPHFPIGIVATAGDPCKIESGSAMPTDATRMCDGVVQRRHVFLGKREVAEWEAGADDGFSQTCCPRTLDAAPVEPCAHAVQAGEKLFAVRVVHDADDRCVFLERLVAVDERTLMGDEGDGDGILWNAMQEVGGAIE